MKIFAGFLILALAVPVPSMAQSSAPADITMTHCALAIGDQALFVSDQPTDNPCVHPCSAAPFLAAENAVEVGLWTLAPTTGGRQWIYDGAPLFLWPEIGANYGRHYFGYSWMADYYGLRPAIIKDPLGEGLAFAIDDPRVSTAPTIERRILSAYNLSSRRDVGIAQVFACVDRQGRAGQVAVRPSSGSGELDEIALDFVRHVQFVPAKTSTGEPIATCGIAVTITWGANQGGSPQLKF